VSQVTGHRSTTGGRPRDARPSNVYRLGADQQVSRERQAFARYQEYFNVPSEF
jgi:hypothetical protein